MKFLQRNFLIIPLLLLAPAVFGQGTITQILTNGPTDKRINIVFLAEGYLESQTNQFGTHVKSVLANILGTSPFNAYSNYFNAFAIFVPSLEAGSDHPFSGIFKETYFNSTFDSYGVNRLLTIPPNDRDSSYSHGQGKVDALLQSLLPDYDLAALVVNDSTYGGSGGSTLITSVNSSSPEIAVHEMAHTYSNLGDEYDSAYPGYPDIEEANTTQETDRSLIKWREWIDLATPLPTPETVAYGSVVGLFEGAHYHSTGWYRPKLNCKMNFLGNPFCEICAEELIKSTYELVRPIESFFPPTNSIISLINTQTVTLAVTPLQPPKHKLIVQWFTNGISVSGATNASFTIDGSALSLGLNQVKAVVSDPTPSVRVDPFDILKQSQIWQISAQALPLLDARLLPGKIVLSWETSASDFVLEVTTNLNAGLWISAGPATLVNDRFTVTNTAMSGTAYYRLRNR